MRKKILVVDDESHVLRLLLKRLTHAGYKVMAADNGKDALRCASKHQPDLIFLDIIMPKLDGYEVLKKLRTAKKTCSIPVVMLTAKAEEESKIKAAGLYAEDYIVKPFQIESLEAKAEEILKRYGR